MVVAYNISLCEYGERTLPKKFALLVPFGHASYFFSGLSLFIVFASDQSVTRTDWSRPEVSIHGAGQMDRSLWGRECSRWQNWITFAHAQLLEGRCFDHKWRTIWFRMGHGNSNKQRNISWWKSRSQVSDKTWFLTWLKRLEILRILC